MLASRFFFYSRAPVHIVRTNKRKEKKLCDRALCIYVYNHYLRAYLYYISGHVKWLFNSIHFPLILFVSHLRTRAQQSIINYIYQFRSHPTRAINSVGKIYVYVYIYISTVAYALNRRDRRFPFTDHFPTTVRCGKQFKSERTRFSFSKKKKEKKERKNKKKKQNEYS